MRDLFEKNRTWLSIAFYVAAILVLTARWLSLVNVPGEIDESRWAMRDFRDAIYFPCRSIAEGHNPYDTKEYVDRVPVGQLFPLYSPLTLLLHQPFSWPPQASAYWIYFCVTILLTTLLAGAVLWICGCGFRWEDVFWLSGFLLLSRPGQMNLLLGQSTVQAVLFCIGALCFADRKPRLAGLMLALATFKPTFGALLFLLMLARRNYRAALWGLAIGCVLTLPLFGYLASIEGGVGEFVEVLGQTSRSFDEHKGRNPLTSFTRVDSYVLWCKIFGVVGDNGVEYLYALVMIGLVGGIMFWRLRLSATGKSDSAHDKTPTIRLSSCLILLTLLVCIYHHAYDWLLVVLPLIWLMVARRQALLPKVNKYIHWAMMGLLLLPAFNYVSTNTGKGIMGDDGTIWWLITMTNSAALLVAWLLMLVVFIQHGDADEENASG